MRKWILGADATAFQTDVHKMTGALVAFIDENSARIPQGIPIINPPVSTDCVLGDLVRFENSGPLG